LNNATLAIIAISTEYNSSYCSEAAVD